MRNMLLITLSVGLALAGSACAQDVASGSGVVRASYAQCVDRSGGVTSDMLDCIGAETRYQDKRLNTAYRALMATGSQQEQARLRSDERAWISHRDTRCSVDPDGGTAAEVNAQDCYLSETARRAAYLESKVGTHASSK